MTIQQTPVFSSAARLNTPGAAPRSEAAPASNDSVAVKGEIDEKNFSWLDLGKGIAGAAVGGAIEGVGIGASSLVRAPQVAYESVKGVWKSKMLGPVLKATLTPVVIAAGLAAPVLATLGGVMYGMFEGFKEGAEKNPLAVIPAAVDTIKQFHTDLAGKAVEGVRELAEKSPENPDEVYEIRVIDAGKGLIGSAAGAAIAGAGVGASSLVNLPGAYVKASKEIWKSDVALPLKVGGQALATAAAVVGVPLCAVGGALYGLGTGAFNGYQEGVVDAGAKAVKDVAKFHDAVSEFAYGK